MSRSALSDPQRVAIRLRRPTAADAAGVRALVEACPPLDVNSTYAYLLVCTHFSATSVVAEADGGLVGFVSSYLKPEDASVLFIWQVAVDARMRGHGLAGRLLDEALRRPACAGIRSLEATISPSNAASWAVFRAFASRHAAACDETPCFEPHHFAIDDDQGHEAERLVRIGPIPEDA
jgi:L-2,4-diaminobutyric acid acetyltransferase